MSLVSWADKDMQLLAYISSMIVKDTVPFLVHATINGYDQI